jgi:hypothetical protein
MPQVNTCRSFSHNKTRNKQTGDLAANARYTPSRRRPWFLLDPWPAISETMVPLASSHSLRGFESESVCHETLMVHRERSGGMGLSY